MRGSVGCRYVLPILHPSLIPPFALVSHTLCIDVMYRWVVHSLGNELPPSEDKRRPTLLALGSRRQKCLASPTQKGGFRGSRFELDPTNFAYLFCPIRILSNPFTLLHTTLLFLPMMAFPGTPQQGLFPIRRPINAPPGIGARHLELRNPRRGTMFCQDHTFDRNSGTEKVFQLQRIIRNLPQNFVNKLGLFFTK